MRALPVALFPLALLLAALFSGCSGEVSVDQEFVNLYVELRIAEMTYGKTSPMTRLVRQDALKAAGYTRESFLAKADEILGDERQWVPFQKAVNARIDSLLAPPAASAAAPGANTGNGPQKVAPKMPKPQPNMPAHKGGVR
ncbi:hypothetical protein [Fibrobacter sp. UWH4]|uniref:hypothetical protein n=1 Tax=Fibrobacter sp. UWH4 TaxID=1896210 RepID=UPI000914A6D8|nr:hypothetical protein [Fibrobacter sp. UWH4]MDD5941734.1 hypothetical protein [Fibrobacter sp.]SHL40463.1 hypothetical protein SAMN05720762_10613 [Fibrobacter sp. UWH4]